MTSDSSGIRCGATVDGTCFLLPLFGCFTGYFRGQEVTGIPEIVVPVYERTTPAPEEPTASAAKSARSAPANLTPSSSKDAGLLVKAQTQHNARLSLLLISLVACLLCVSFISFPSFPLNPRLVLSL